MSSNLMRFLLLLGVLTLTVFQSYSHNTISSQLGKQTVLSESGNETAETYYFVNPESNDFHYRLVGDETEVESVLEEKTEEEDSENNIDVKVKQQLVSYSHYSSRCSCLQATYKAKRWIPSHYFKRFTNQTRNILYSVFRI